MKLGLYVNTNESKDGKKHQIKKPVQRVEVWKSAEYKGYIYLKNNVLFFKNTNKGVESILIME